MGLVWGLIIGVVVLGGGYLLWANSQDGPTNVTVTESNNDATGTSLAGSGAGNDTDVDNDGLVDVDISGDVDVATAPMTATVTYDGSSFTPRSVTIARGGTVTWVNESGGNMWVASARHPDHTVYAGTTRQQHCPDTSGTAFDQCQGGGNYSFTFTKTGSWNYHDHINASVFGTVVVE